MWCHGRALTEKSRRAAADDPHSPGQRGRKVATTLTRDRISAVVDSQDEQVGHVVEVSGDVAYVDPVTDPAVSMAVNQNRIRGRQRRPPLPDRAR